jgi:hypothetical protein
MTTKEIKDSHTQAAAPGAWRLSPFSSHPSIPSSRPDFRHGINGEPNQLEMDNFYVPGYFYPNYHRSSRKKESTVGSPWPV